MFRISLSLQGFILETNLVVLGSLKKGPNGYFLVVQQMRLSEQSQACLFCLRNNFEHKKSTKTQNKQLSRSQKVFIRAKTCCFCCFCLFVFVLLVGFGLICVFVRSKSIRKKKKKIINRPKVVLITSFTILLTCTPINPFIKNLFVHTYFYL